MTTKLTQRGPDVHESGTAAFHVVGPVVAQIGEPELCEIAIVQNERHLDPRDPDEPWKTAVYYFWPLKPRLEGTGLWFEIDHGVTFHLRATTPYKLRIRSLLGGEAEEVFTLPASTRRPSVRPSGWVPPPDPRGPVTAPVAAAPVAPPPPPPPPPPAPEPVPPAPEPAPVPTPAPVEVKAEVPAPPPIAEPKPRKWLVPVALLLLLLAGGAGYVMFAGGGGETQLTMDECRKLVGSDPEAAVARDKADTLAKSGTLPDCQFLLFKYAAGKNDSVAARVLGTYYDPDTWSKDKSPLPAPNPAEAARWHKQAADAGDAESQYRYGMLLKLGRTEEPDGPEKAQVYLRKAAEAGHAQAKEALTK